MNVLLSSGGLDSALLAAMWPGALHLSINYGQEHMRELRSARAVAQHYRAEHVEKGCRLPHKHGEVVPGRNAVLIALAAAVAQDRGGGTVLIGCNGDDDAGFPDCRPGFIAAMRDAVELASTGTVTVAAPLLGWTKARIGAQARRLGVPVELTWSCYRGLVSPCGTCDTADGTYLCFAPRKNLPRLSGWVAELDSQEALFAPPGARPQLSPTGRPRP